jgi:hypothetical protein
MRASVTASRINGRGAFEALLAPIDGTAARHLAAAGSLGDAAIDSDIFRIQTDHTVIGIQHELLEPVHDAVRDPFVPAPP